jgi:hypothetical protein
MSRWLVLLFLIALPAAALEPRDQKLEDAAARYAKSYGPDVEMDRYASFDLAMPRDADEYRALGRNSVLLVVAVSRKREELPVANAHIGDLMLARIGEPRISEMPAGSKARSMFGAYRDESFFLVPLAALYGEGKLEVDFARTRKDFVLALLPLTKPKWKELIDGKAASRPADQPLNAFILREFP